MPDDLMPQPTNAAPEDMLVSPQPSLPTLQKWFGDEMVDIWGGFPPTDRRWLLTGCPAWGHYADHLVRWTIPTMLAPENLKALVPCWLVVLTDPTGYAQVHTATKHLRGLGIHTVIRLIPEPVLEVARKHPANRYWVLGAAQNLLIRMADFAGAGFHQLHPDHLYAKTFYANLKRLSAKHAMIAQTGISAVLHEAVLELEAFRHERGWIEIPDRDLGDIGWRHMHPQTRAYLMNEAVIPDSMPNAHYLAWQGQDAIVSHCCHMNAVWLSPDICRTAPNFMPATIDTRLPHFSNEFYVPTVTDNMTFIEISGADKASAKRRVDFDMFAARCWSQTGFSERYMPYFLRPSKTPIHKQATFMSDASIASQAKEIADLLMAVKPPAWLTRLQQTPMHEG